MRRLPLFALVCCALVFCLCLPLASAEAASATKKRAFPPMELSEAIKLFMVDEDAGSPSPPADARAKNPRIRWD